MQTPPRRGKKSRVAAKKPNTAAEPAAAKHVNAKPDGTPKAAEKPAKPKAVVKPKPKSTTSEANPVDQATAPHT